MTDHATLLHNMSAPPRTVIRYSGLAGAATTVGPGGSGVCSVKYSHDSVYGTFIAFRLPPRSQGCSVKDLFELIGEESGRDPQKRLLELINRRAGELPIPDGCAIKPCESNHLSPWPDLLAALAIITKSSANVWLRSKAPSLFAIQKRSAVSLLLPPAFAGRMSEFST